MNAVLETGDNRTEAYFFELLLRKQTVRTGLSDIAESVLFKKDDSADESNWKAATFEKSSTRPTKIGENDKTTLLSALFHTDVRTPSDLDAAIELAISESAEWLAPSGMVFEFVLRFLETHLNISDSDFAIFLQSSIKEEAEHEFVNAFVPYFQKIESFVRKGISKRTSLLETLTYEDDAISPEELDDFLSELYDEQDKLIGSIEKDASITGPLETFQRQLEKIRSLSASPSSKL